MASSERVPVVLMLDDDVDLLEMMGAIFQAAGSKIITASSVDQAFDAFSAREQEQLPIDQVWTDLRAPDKGAGINFLHRVIHNFPSAISEMGVVVMSGTIEDFTKDEDSYFSSRIREVRKLNKPFDVSEVINNIKELGVRLPSSRAA